MNLKKILMILFVFISALYITGCKKKNTETKTTIENTTTNTDRPTTKEIITTTIKETTDLFPATETDPITSTVIETTTSISDTVITGSTLSYYSNFDFQALESMSSTEAKDYIHDYIYVTLKNQSYDSAKDYFYKTDENPDTGLIQLFYTHKEVSAGTNNRVTFGSSNGTINREHVWPQSLGDSKSQQGGYDLHHIRPTLYETNNARGNKIYGNVEHTSSNAQKYDGVIYAYMTSKVFEPVDDVKGDVARIVFYYSIMYGYDLSIIVSDDTFSEILEWNRIDPVSDVEINRNNQVFNIQGNRNIFIDYPELADLIWG